MKPFRAFFAVVAWCVVTVAAAATCEELRAEIETKIATAGVARFTVTIADASATLPAAGRVVGTCDRGARNIVYEVQGGGATGTGTRPRNPRADAILTECRDGSQSVGGDCKN